jgi:predicted small lipoprotein YifL
MKKFATFAIMAAMLAACGVKGRPDRPPEAKYKRTYPTY